VAGRGKVGEEGTWKMSGIGGEERNRSGEVNVPLSEIMIHIKNAVKVKASGKMRRRTIHRGAFCY
jgi:hypothetical protein